MTSMSTMLSAIDFLQKLSEHEWKIHTAEVSECIQIVVAGITSYPVLLSKSIGVFREYSSSRVPVGCKDQLTSLFKQLVDMLLQSNIRCSQDLFKRLRSYIANWLHQGGDAVQLAQIIPGAPALQ